MANRCAIFKWYQYCRIIHILFHKQNNNWSAVTRKTVQHCFNNLESLSITERFSDALSPRRLNTIKEVIHIVRSLFVQTDKVEVERDCLLCKMLIMISNGFIGHNQFQEWAGPSGGNVFVRNEKVGKHLNTRKLFSFVIYFVCLSAPSVLSSFFYLISLFMSFIFFLLFQILFSGPRIVRGVVCCVCS